MENFPNYPPDVQQEILNGAALTPPVGQISNFDDPPNHNTEALAVAVICISLAMMAGLLRVYSRLFVVKKVHLEDYVAFAAFAFYGGFLWTYFSFYTICGFFVHQWDIQVKTLFKISYVVIILPLMYASVMLLIKPAILLEWTRIFVPYSQRNKFFWIARILMLVNVLLYLSGIVATSLACIPLAKLWHTWLPGKCIDRKALDICTATFNLILDIVILILPQRVIWKLQMTTSRKVGISLVFSIGLLACACAAGRLYACVTQPYASTSDTTYTLGRTFLWAMAETTCVLLVFCIPAIPKAFTDNQKGFISHIARSMRSWTRFTSRSLGSRKKSEAEDGSWLPFDQDSLQQQGTTSNATTYQYRTRTIHGRNMSLEEIKLVQDTGIKAGTDDFHGQAHRPVYGNGSGILRTTEVSQDEESVPRLEVEAHRENPYLEQQHPWIQR